VVGAQLAGSLTWLALSGEDAPDLLRAAPIDASRIARHKIQAVLTPIALLLAAPIAALAFAAPWAALWAALFTLGAGVSTALLNLWRQSPSPRGMMLRRHSQSKIVGMLEHLLAIVWAIGAAMAVMGFWSALVPVLLAGLILWLSRSRQRRVSFPASA
jgi:ABC-2 type transport system permease protein